MEEVGNKEAPPTKTLKGELGDLLKPSSPKSKKKQSKALAKKTSELPLLLKGATAR
jgi:hypothetical protein